MKEFKSMGFASLIEVDKLEYPVICSPKISGIRATVVDGKVLLKNGQEVGNKYIRDTILLQTSGEEMDGIIVLADDDDDVTQYTGQPDFVFWVFDIIGGNPYYQRMKYLDKACDNYYHNVKLLEHFHIFNKPDLLKYYDSVVNEGYDGIIVRSTDAPYKHGQSTEKEAFGFKMMPWHEGEAIIYDFMPVTDRNTKEKKEELSAFIVQITGGITFGLGTGLTEVQRKAFWNERSNLTHKTVLYKYHTKNQYNTPRNPVFAGIKAGK